MKKNIYIVGLLFLCMILFSGRAYAVECGLSGNDSAKTVDCLQKIFQGIGTLPSGTATETTSIAKEVMKSNSGLATLQLQSGSNSVILIKDLVLMDFIYKFVVIFGIGYLIVTPIFKR